MNDENSRQDTKKHNWKLVVSLLFLTVIITVLFIVIINIIIKTSQTNANQLGNSNNLENDIEENLNQNNIEELVNLEDLTSVANKTEEELKKQNEEELKKEEKKQNNTTTTVKKKNKYYIKVNYNAQVVNIYTYDKKGKYTVPVKAFVCSTGTETPTSGVYKIPAKIEWCFMFGDVYAHYCTQIVGNILFHSVPYLEKRNDTLEYWAYDLLGTKASMGCIRLTTRDAKWIFENIPYGTEVEFYSSSNPGPLGKPSAQKISDAPEELKNWDPTDPDSRNPWHTYVPEEEKKEENNTVENEIQNNEETNNEIVNNEITNNELQNNETQNNEVSNNENQSNNVENEEIKNNEVSDNEEQNNEAVNDKIQNNEESDNNEQNNEAVNNESSNNKKDDEINKETSNNEESNNE